MSYDKRYRQPSDGFCGCCPFENYSNAGLALDYVQLAVEEKLRRDSYVITTCLDGRRAKEQATDR